MLRIVRPRNDDIMLSKLGSTLTVEYSDGFVGLAGIIESDQSNNCLQWKKGILESQCSLQVPTRIVGLHDEAIEQKWHVSWS